MKKYLILFLTLSLLLLCGCEAYVSIMPGTEAAETAEGSEEFSPVALTEFLGWQDFASNYYDDTPVALSYTGPEGYTSAVFDRESIIKACDTLRNITVTEPLEDEETDDIERSFCFTMEDGSTHTLNLCSRGLHDYTGDYVITGAEALEEIAFPCYDDNFGVFDLYYSEDITAFAENFSSDMPVSVARRSNGGAVLTSDSEDIVRQVFEILRDSQMTATEPSPDQNINLNNVEDYIFTMADGHSYTFTLTGSCLTVTVNDVYGAIYYYFSGAEELQNLEILPENTAGQFEGGSITGLREDIQTGADAAEGLLTDSDGEAITVIGVYASFDIDGTQDYITLQDEEAADFMRTLASMQVTGEQLEELPSGAEITVWVTLSDWSGPVFYFNDGAVQQAVGIWYRVDADSYANMRSSIWSIYSSQIENRVTEVETDTEDSEE